MEIEATCNNYNEYRLKYPGAREAAFNKGWIPDVNQNCENHRDIVFIVNRKLPL